MQNLAALLRHGIQLGTRRSDDFTILVSIWGHPRYLTNLNYLQQHKANVLFIVNATTPELKELASELEGDGWKVHRTELYEQVAPVSMIESGLGLVTTKYAIRLDGDTSAKSDIGIAVATMEDAGQDLCSVIVLPSKRQSLAEKLQGLEYDMAMRARRYRPHLTSGACYIATTAALRQIVTNHTHWYFAEDTETGLVAKHFKMNVGHLYQKVYTDVPETFRQLARQRRGWWAGHFRRNIVNMDHMTRYPVALVYGIGLIYLTLVGKWMSLFSHWELLPVILVAYVFVTLIANWEVRSKWMAIFPLYSLIQILVFPAVGVIWFIRTRFRTGRPARLLVGWRRRQWVTQ